MVKRLAPKIALLRAPLTPPDLVRIAVQEGSAADRLQTLIAMEERWRAGQAAMAFIAAMVEFKKAAPKIYKLARGRRQDAGGKVTEWAHETLDVVCEAATPALAACGFTHDWEPTTEPGRVTVTCVLSHLAGHSKRVSLWAAPDDSDGKNSIQAVKSTVTYLERITLLAVTGLAAKGMDDDGRRAGRVIDPAQVITKKQASELRALLRKSGSSVERFLRFWQIESLAEMLAVNFTTGCEQIRAREAA